MAPALTLTPPGLEFGKQLTATLKRSGFPYKGVFWLFEDQIDDWQLVVVTSLVEERGRREAYLTLSKATSDIVGTGFQQLRITVMSPDTPLYQALSSVFGSAASVEGARLRNTSVNGITVPEAYLYEIL